ncbi:MAG TPA: hypothetical protein PLB90_06340 [Opitutaceae bacterium]|nr:hypothetical protein [Opitutaceae bacterium]
MHAPRAPAIDVLPRTPQRTTALNATGAHAALIIHPAGDHRYATLAAAVAAAVHAQCGVRPACSTDVALLPERSTPLPAAHRQRPLIVLGSLNTNRVLQPLYADFLCSTDATYPGGDGYDLRTVVNPYGTGTNVLLAGGSTLRGVERAVERLVAVIGQSGPAATVPWLLEVELAPVLAAQLAAWPYTSLADSAALQASRARGLMFITEPIRLIGAYTLMWAWTGDVRYAKVACDQLRWLNEVMVHGYGDWHYLAERFMRAIPLLVAGGFLTDEEILRTDHLLMLTALANQDEWWRMRTGRPPLGHRHQGKGTYEFLLIARYLRDQARPTPALRATCDRWITECASFLDALAAARLDDQDDESCLNNLATLFRYALGQERHTFFTSGNARLVAERCLALHDNNGAGAGQGGYGESQGMYLQQEATVQTAASAFYYGDGRLKWILQKLPNLAVPQRCSFLHFYPVFLQKFDTGPELVPVPPIAGETIRCLPISDHIQSITTNPPVHIEPAGHMVNAIETWEVAEGIGLNRLPQVRGFDKIMLRAGYERSDAYLMIQGYQGGFRWQGHMQATNAIVRFFQHGHVWLVQNTSRHSFNDKNGLFISDGRNDTLMPPVGERRAIADFAPAGLIVTRLSDYHHAEWTRHLFWSKAGDGCFVVLDRVRFTSDGPFSVTCTWRTPAFAEQSGRRWVSEQGTHRFTLVAGANYPSTCEEEFDQGACAPYVLRQRTAGVRRAGEELSFQNLFYVRPQSAAERLDLQPLDPRGAVVRREGVAVAWCGLELAPGTAWLPGASARAMSAWIEPGSVVLAGATLLDLPALGCRIESDTALSLCLDLAAATLVLRIDDPEVRAARVSVTVGPESRGLTLAGEQFLTLPEAEAAILRSAIATWLNALPAEAAAVPAAPPAPADRGWARQWAFDSGTRVPERVRRVNALSCPLPIDNAPDQLLDPVMPDGYSREIWIQWPQAAEYAVSLRFPTAQAVSQLNILGDCIDDPSLRTFNPLPDGIQVEVESADGARRACAVTAAPDRRYKRYRDAENRLEAKAATVDATAKAIHLRFPAPAGRPFVLHRLEILNDRSVAPAIQHWLAADLNGDGRSEIIAVNATNELIVIGDDGRELWRRPLANPVTHVSCQPLDPSGPPVLCVGLLGGELHQFNGDGSPRRVLKLAEEFRQRTDCLMGWYNAIHSLAIWHRGKDGRGSLILGGYGINVYLNADGRIVGHGFGDGPWMHDILVTPPDRPGAGDIFVRCGWNHGIQYYEGVPGDGPSGVLHSFGGFQQPMFRMLRRVIPFVNGRSIAYRWAEVPEAADGAIFAAAELGCGILSTTRKEWLWKVAGGMSLNAACLGRVDGRRAALVGGADGFVIAHDLSNGQVLRSWHAGAPVVGLDADDQGGLTVATRTGVHTLDPAWRPSRHHALGIRRLLPLGAGRVAVVRDDHTIDLLAPA